MEAILQLLKRISHPIMELLKIGGLRDVAWWAEMILSDSNLNLFISAASHQPQHKNYCYSLRLLRLNGDRKPCRIISFKFPRFSCCEVHFNSTVFVSLKLYERSHNFIAFLSPQSTPLHLAAGYNRVRIVQLLLQHGADVHAKDKGYVHLCCLTSKKLREYI